jgi:hypothetical protein
MAWLCILIMLGFYGWQLVRIGNAVRDDFWVYWQNNRFYEDSQNALLNGRLILRGAEAQEHADQSASAPASPDTDADRPTLAHPGPGLFDSPADLYTVWHRWQRQRPVYAHLIRGWIATYDSLVHYRPDGEYQFDYPPLRSLVITLWVWHVRIEHPLLIDFPQGRTLLYNPKTHHTEAVTADIIHPLLICNRIAEGVSAVAMFFLVWIWVRRGNDSDKSAFLNPASESWRDRWGDPLLLIPPVLLGLFLLARPFTRFDLSGADPAATLLDSRATSAGWWIYLLLRYLSVVALARVLPLPFRGVTCGLVAATLVWINPAAILDSVGWPQWDTWIVPFFLIAAVLVSLDCWLTAGLVLAVGGMFKGQTFFIAPVLILCPLFAGWISRFVRIIAGMAAGTGLIVGPWMVNNSRCGAFITAAILSAGIVCILSTFRRPVGHDIGRFFSGITRRLQQRWLPRSQHQSLSHTQETGTAAPTPIPAVPSIEPAPAAPCQIPLLIWIGLAVAMLTAAFLPLLLCIDQSASLRCCTIVFTLAILLVPWFIQRKMIAPWLVLTFATALWLGACSLHGDFSWWSVGFKYGTQKFQRMQLGFESLSNLSSILEHRYGWKLHDSVGTLRLPLIAPIELDVQSTLALLFGFTLLLNTVAAGVHLRRRDPKFLMTLVVPWMLFVTLLTQMAARYTIFAAVMGAALVGVSLSVSLLQLLCVILSCTMLGMQMLRFDPTISPTLYSIARATFPDMGWLTLLLAAVMLVIGMTPTRRAT